MATGQGRSDLDFATVADIVWSMNAPGIYLCSSASEAVDVARSRPGRAEAWKRLLPVKRRAGDPR